MHVKATLIAAAYILVTLGVASLITGCTAMEEIGRATYHACKDGHCG